MDTWQTYADRLDAQMRAADAQLDELEAGARARDAQTEMDEISGLRERRDRVRQQVADARREAQDDSEVLRSRVDQDWSAFRRSVADAHNRYTDWDAARERRFYARLDQADAVVREEVAAEDELAARASARIAGARDELRDRAAEARRKYDAWRERQEDQVRRRALDDAALELEEASHRYASALADVQRGSQARGE
ncbi:MAG TPA: hypothetical protein VF092_13550 [Longimicrobium sp.]